MLNTISNWFLIGVIWLLQLAHYPLLSKVGSHVDESIFRSYSHYLNRHTLMIAVLPMVIEMLVVLWLFWKKPSSSPPYLYKASAILLVVIWGVLLIVQFPLHQILSQGYHVVAHHSVTLSNWVITFAWTIKGVISIVILSQFFNSARSDAA